MARGLVLSYGDEESTFGLSKVDREKLYGRRDRVVVDESGQACTPAHLLSDGTALIPSGGTSYLYTDAGFDVIERSALVGVNAAGDRVPLCPSTLGVAQKLTEVEASRILDHVVTTVYALAPEAVSPALKAKLAAGAVFETRFNWREDYADAPAFVLENGEGCFALVAAPTSFGYVERESAVEPVVEDDAADDGELDFGMI